MDADGVDLSPALRRLCGGVLPKATLHKLRGDASTRSYYRVRLVDAPGTAPQSLIAMRLPEDVLGSDEGQASHAPTELPFVDVQRMLAARGLPVPRIFVDDTQGRVLLLEDLGDETFAARLDRVPRSEWGALYGKAVDLLVSMHRACALGAPAESIAFRRSFEPTLLRWELDHFAEWGLSALIGALPEAEHAALDAELSALCESLVALPQGFVHRDYQSRNLMWAPGDRLTLIDFQDAMQGPAVYDLCALLCDSYVALELPEQQAAIDRYAAGMDLTAEATGALHVAFWRVASQRKLKDSGRFVFIDRVRGNPDFLRFYPQSMRYAGRALRMAGRTALYGQLQRLLPGFPDALPVPPAATGSARTKR
ncbi:MAG: aminoglycoside phosphotransferase family protein [Polyangiales bacterium]